MSEFVTKPEAQGQQQQKIETRSPIHRLGALAIAGTVVAAAFIVAALFAQGQSSGQNATQNNAGQSNDKYALVSPGGIAFSDFKGYEDWSVVSSSHTEERLKVIVANPTMIQAYKAGIPGNGQPFPDGSMIVKLQWTQKKSTEAPFVVDVPDVFKEAFVIEKDSKRFPKSAGWGYAVFNYDAASDKFTPDPKSLSDCGNACHTIVNAKDYIFHPYQKR